MSQFIAQGQYPKYLAASGLVKTGPCRLARVIITSTTSLLAAVYDNISAAGNIVLAIPVSATAGTIYLVDWPCINGIYFSITSGTGTVAISFDDGMSGQ